MALLSEDGGVAARVVEKAGANRVDAWCSGSSRRSTACPASPGPGRQPGQVYISPRVNEVLTGAEAAGAAA